MKEKAENFVLPAMAAAEKVGEKAQAYDDS